MGDCPPALPADLEDPPRRDQLCRAARRTGPRAKKLRAQKLTQALRKLGYQVTLAPITPAQTGVTPG